MNALATKSLILGVSLLLALPTGWCCGLFAREDISRQQSVRSCCQPPLAELPAEEGSAPVDKGLDCCCSHSTYLPSEPVVTVEVAASAVLFAVPDLPVLAPAPNAALSFGRLYSPGPRLHLLQCVWRC